MNNRLVTIQMKMKEIKRKEEIKKKMYVILSEFSLWTKVNLWERVSHDVFKNLDFNNKKKVIGSVGFNKNYSKTIQMVSKIAYKQQKIIISTKSKIYKYLYISIDHIGTNLWTPRTHKWEFIQ